MVSERQEDGGGGAYEKDQMRTRQGNPAGRTVVIVLGVGIFFFFGILDSGEQNTARAGAERSRRGSGLTGQGQILGPGGAVDGGQHGVGEALQHGAVVLGESVRVRREGFENADRLISHAHGRGQNGANAERATTVAIHA